MSSFINDSWRIPMFQRRWIASNMIKTPRRLAHLYYSGVQLNLHGKPSKELERRFPVRVKSYTRFLASPRVFLWGVVLTTPDVDPLTFGEFAWMPEIPKTLAVQKDGEPYNGPVYPRRVLGKSVLDGLVLPLRNPDVALGVKRNLEAGITVKYVKIGNENKELLVEGELPGEIRHPLIHLTAEGPGVYTDKFSPEAVEISRRSMEYLLSDPKKEVP